MDQQRLNYLVQQYMTESATARELEELSNIIRSDADSGPLKSLLSEMMQKETPAYPPDRERWQQMAMEIVKIDKPTAPPAETLRARVVRSYHWSAAAAILFVMAVGAYFWANQKHTPLLSAAETTIRDSIITTARGEQREIILPDGTHVWLNAASSIRFPADFANGPRTVELSGEAFFDVRHAEKIPFLIHSGAITTTVLGTAFDITAYPRQKNTKVAVQSGKVKVQAGNKVLAVLESGRQLRINSGIASGPAQIDASSIAAWKTGSLVYKDEILEDIVAGLQRTFSDSIEIKTPALKNTMITLSFNKSDGLQHALELICRTTDSRLSRKNGIFTIE